MIISAGRELMQEMAAKRERERQRFSALEAEVTGRGAQTVRLARAPPCLLHTAPYPLLQAHASQSPGVAVVACR